MSAQGGLYNRAGGPVDAGILSRITKSLEHWGPDGGGNYLAGSFGATYRALCTNRMSRSETQPFVIDSGSALTWDGRLDNRKDLLPQLRHLIQNDETDVALVMAGFQKWGLRCLERIVGDWALTLWNPCERALILARDFTGNRPLYYAAAKDLVIWSSQLETFLELTDAQSQLCDEHMFEFMVSYPRGDRTPYANVFAVPPGGVVLIVNSSILKGMSWEPDVKASILYQRDQDYEDHFRQLFREAVRCRLRVDGEAWSELSGGLDSSSIVCIADEILREEPMNVRSLKTVSYVLRSDCDDDYEYILQVEAKRGQKGFHLSDDSHAAFFPEPSAPVLARPQGLPGRLTALARDMERRGARVLLSGEGGDGIMWSSRRRNPNLADLLMGCRVGELHRQLQAFSLATRRPYWDLLWNEAIKPWLLQEVSLGEPEAPTWLRTKGVTRRLLMTKTAQNGSMPRPLSPSRAQSLLLILDSVKLCTMQHFRTCGVIEATYPFLDRRIIQFMLAIPFDQKVRPAGTRWVHRGSMQGILPEAILNRTTKVSGAPYVCRALHREWGRIEEMFTPRLRIAERGYVDKEALFEAVVRARDGREGALFPLTRALGAEVWLRDIERIRQSGETLSLTKAPVSDGKMRTLDDPVFHFRA